MIFEKKRIIQPMLIIVILLGLFIPLTCVNATPECSYGFFDVWFSLDGESWLNTTVTNISLNCGEPFFIKASMRPTAEHIWLALYLFEPGTSSLNQSSFKRIDGPCEVNNGCDLGKARVNETKIVTWKLKVKDHPAWIGGFTPLSITAFFQKKINNSWQTEEISFSIARIFLNETSWSSTVQMSPEDESFSSMRYQLVVPAIIGLLFFFVFVKKTR